MSRRCLICADINPCRQHTAEAQFEELRRNCREVERIQAIKEGTMKTYASLTAARRNNPGKSVIRILADPQEVWVPVDSLSRTEIMVFVDNETSTSGRIDADQIMLGSGEKLGECRKALETVKAFIGVMCGRGPEATIPETVQGPLGIPIKVGEIMRDVDKALA